MKQRANFNQAPSLPAAAGVNRLPEPAGRLVDRQRPVRFHFDGKSYTGLHGDTIASALAAHDVWLLSRSFKYHRPRGAASLAGLEADTLVQLPDEPNVAADLRLIEDGMQVRGQNCPGGLTHDWNAVLFGALARFLPVGFYYKSMFRPRGAWQWLWEPLVRRQTGLGRVRIGIARKDYDKCYGFYTVVVVGAGPAGLAAAASAARNGAEVLLIEQQTRLGGSLNSVRPDTRGSYASLRRKLIEEVEASPRIEVMKQAVCNGWFADHWLPVLQGNRMHKIRTAQLVLATGVMEQPAVFRNNDLPGVMLGSAAQRLVRLYGVRPGKRAAVLSADSAGYQVALDLHEAGVEVVAVLDMRADPEQDAALRQVRKAGITLIANSMIYEAFPSRNRRHLGAIAVANWHGEQECRPAGIRIDCDLLCTSVGSMPGYQLALQAGARLEYQQQEAGFRITGMPAGMQIAGAANGFATPEAAAQDGALAGWQASSRSGAQGTPQPPAPGQRSIRNHPWPICAHPRGGEFVDRDEDLQIADIRNSCDDGYAELELVKRYSTVGMGPSQGRHSALACARLVARHSGRSLDQVGVTTARPPLCAEKLGQLAGRSFAPERHTPMHHRHLEAGAQMMNVGAWWRPAYYGPPSQRSQCIHEEVLAVRHRLGMIDVSTLGGLEIRGPDAAEFLNRVYTFSYLKQETGRSRYVLMTNLAGFIIDDGVACRLAEDHYYVTATTGGAENVYRTMLWWNAQWCLQVDVTNVTAAYAGISLSGPRSREVLQKLCPDLDLSAQAFPYLGVRSGIVAGIPARLLRVGFVGELGYEIHVPASEGETLWDRLRESGGRDGVRPAGIEAQRLLRLEKGHLLVGQDTDATTTPGEAGMAWAVSRRKPFFVGGRSLELRARQAPKRRLAAFAIDDPEQSVPAESSLVLRGEVITGHVTSVARSPTLQRIIGLAYVPAQVQTGDSIRIKINRRQSCNARIVATPFYDPENKRQQV